MGNVAIVTDSTACLPKELVEQHGIELVPVEFTCEGKVYRDGVDISPTEFYTLLALAKKLPITSPASPGNYLMAFKKAALEVNSILCITVSAKFSGMFDSARAATELARETISNVTIEVLDCRTAAGAQGLVVLSAARAVAVGKSLTEVIKVAKNTMSKVYFVAALDTLHYLAKGGRVPQVAAWASSLLKVKPVIQLLPLSGEACPAGTARTMPKAWERLVALVLQRVGTKPVHVMVNHSNALREARRLEEYICSKLNCIETYVSDFTPVMGVHTGPGLFGIAFYTEDGDVG